ncbi:hypothetical protein ENH_00006790 [Eimeria necatrix]|uniref:dolichyl-diphosphooligosaccharide--protein glycotransferase n=1 Tax=Eimeria necatrix TaxID=51315 RepID=U6MQC8_9EIME|nr:hypothetical protein ENH_00006790 [Eimeria necatrix]CDJ65283.1 hypothetical protein ENH_00006790 [Eimeria necatrix]
MISALLAAIPSAYMASAWGGYVFLINAIAIHVFALCVLGLITPKHEVAYIVFYVIITAFCINIPFLNFTPLWSSEHMASHGVFVLVIASAVARFASSLVPKDLVKDLQAWVIGLAGLLILIVLSILALTGKTAWSPRSLTLLDPTYATKYIPIVASVSEHQPPTWSTYFLDLHMVMFLAPLGLILSLQRGGGLFFVGLYGVLACYFSAVMVRLVLVLSPAASILAGIGAATLVAGVLSQCRRVYPGGSICCPLHLDGLCGAFEQKHLYGWDYGYQVSEVGNRTVFVDNNTWNSTHIATVGLAFGSEEFQAYEIAQDLDVDYVFVVFGGMARFSSDDLNKLIWMIRIASGVFPDMQQSDYLGPKGQFTVGEGAPNALLNSLLYKLSYQHFGKATKGFDFARKTQVNTGDIVLKHFEEVFTSENWVVRIYKVRKADNRDAKMLNAIESAFL